MNNIKIWYDDIIYSLQKMGGISVVWHYTTNNNTLNCSRIIYDGAESNAYYQKINEHNYQIRKKNLLRIKRYINPRLKSEQNYFIFHSSYYRFCTNKMAINITTVHDFTYELYDRRIIGILHKLQKKRAIEHSDGVICISENTKCDLLKYYPEFNGKIKVIYNGYDTETYFYEKKKKERIVLFVGGRRGYKRFDLTVQIVKKLLDCKLLIIGGGRLTEEEMELLEKEIPQRFEKLGYLSNDELRSLYNRAFFLSYCSDYEGFGIPAIEAQACGCPVVCQKKSSLPEVVMDTGIFIDPENMEHSISKIMMLYDDDYYNEIVRAGLENVKRFSWKKCQEEVLSFYKDVFESKAIVTGGERLV